METTFIERHVRRSNRNLLVVGVVLSALAVAAALLPDYFLLPLALGVPGVLFLFFWLRRLVSPAAHPIYRQLRRYGDPREVGDQVNREFANAETLQPVFCGPRWLISRDTYQGFGLVPWTEIAW